MACFTYRQEPGTTATVTGSQNPLQAHGRSVTYAAQQNSAASPAIPYTSHRSDDTCGTNLDDTFSSRSVAAAFGPLN